MSTNLDTFKLRPKVRIPSPNKIRQARIARQREAIYRAESKEERRELAASYTIVDCIAELEDVRQRAKKKGQTNTEVTAIMGKAKVQGLLIERIQDITDRPDLTKMRQAAQEALSTLRVSEAGIEDVT
jgi:hypothetical protein